MNPTKIEWTDYTWNPVTGCLNDCDYCYARAIANRFKNNFPNGFNPTFWPERLDEPKWVERIIREAERNKIPVFLKKNLGPLFGEFGGRQEFPVVK